MFKVLIVDDEKIERDGIKLLIKKYNLELEVWEAENGKAALEVIRDNPVDILLTDIKMPFMDGLELAEKAKTLLPQLKVIIYSAYGEFDLARKAIHLKVEHYILKPINKEEFARVFHQIMELCRKEAEDSLAYSKILELSRQSLRYEKERVLLDIIGGFGDKESLSKRISSTGLSLEDKWIRLVLFDFRTRFFDDFNEEFKALLKECLPWDYEYLNVNERQSLVFLMSNQCEDGNHDAIRLGYSLNNGILKRFGLSSTIVLGESVDKLEALEEEMNRIDQALDCKFFYEDGTVLFTNSNRLKEYTLNSIEEIAERIYKSIEDLNLQLLQKEIDAYFDYLKEKSSSSIIFVKYTCAEIVKKIRKKTEDIDYNVYRLSIENIFASEDMNQLRDIVHSLALKLDRQNPSDSKNLAKVIRSVLELVEQNYMNDISIEWIAEKVYLTPNYLNLLFKKEIGQSLGKYITYYRLKKAEEYLLNTNMKIVDIGNAVGYTNNSYFCLIFKNYYGITPIKYREMGK